MARSAPQEISRIFSKAWNFAPEIFKGLETAPTLAG
jgi:hypothetical protein